MISHNKSPFSSYASIVYTDTIAKSQEDVNLHKRCQNNTKNPVFYETITFHNAPIPFFGIIILPPGENISFIDEGKEKRFVSESLFDTNTCNIKIFAQILESGSFVYRQLSVLDYTGLGMVFVYDNPNEVPNVKVLVNKILITGSFRSISCLVLRYMSSESHETELNPSGTLPSYFGNDVLDLNTDKIRITDMGTENKDNCSYYGFKKLLDLENRVSESVYKTKMSLVHCILMRDQMEGIKPDKLNDSLKSFCQNKEMLDNVDEVVLSLVKCCDYSNFKFIAALERETLEVVLDLCVSKVTYTFDNHCYKLLEALTYDSRLALAIFQNKSFVDSIFSHLSFKNNTIFNSREPILSLISKLISHSSTMKYFLSSKSDGGHSLYNMLLKNLYNYQQYSVDSTFIILKDISERVALYSALRKTEDIYNGFGTDKVSDNYSQCCYLENLSASINGCLDLMTTSYRHEDITSLVEKDRSAKYYIISYVKETNFLAIVGDLFAKLFDQLSNFPVLFIDVHQMTHKPLLFLQKFVNIFDFSDLFLLLFNIANLIPAICEDVRLLIRKGFPYHSDSIYKFSHVIQKHVYELVLYSSILRIFYSIYDEKSLNSGIEALNTLCNETENGYKYLANVLDNKKLTDFVLDLLRSTIGALETRTETELYHSQLLLFILSVAISRDDTGTLIYILGEDLVSTIELFLSLPFSSSTKLDQVEIRTIKSTLSSLKKVFSSLTDPHRDSGINLFTIESVNDFLKNTIGTSTFIVYPRSTKITLESLKILNKTPVIEEKFADYISSRNFAGPKEPSICDKVKPQFIDEDLDINLVDIDWDCSTISNKKQMMNVPVDKYNYYLDTNIFLVPPTPLPIELRHSLLLLLRLSSKKQYNRLFTGFLLESKQREFVFEVWTHLVSSIIPNLSTLANVDMDIFSSVIGYEWFVSMDSALLVLKTILVLIYRSLRHISSEDVYSPEDNHKVIGLDTQYVNDDLLNLMILTSVQLNSTKIWYYKSIHRDCISWLSRLMFYWFKRFKSSRGHIINHLMKAYITLPKMAEGVSLLFVSCNPNSMSNLSFSLNQLSEADENNKSTKVYFEDKFYLILRTNHSDNDKGHWEINTNTMLLGWTDKLKNIDFSLFVEFIMTVASRSYTVNPVSLILNSHLSYIMITNSLPIMVLLKLVSEKLIKRCVDDINENHTSVALNFVTLYSNILHTCNSIGKIKNSIFFNVAYAIVSFLNKFTKSIKKIPAISYALIYECYLAVFFSNNKLWNNDIISTTSLSEFYDYIIEVNKGVGWIFHTLNKSRIVSSMENINGEPNEVLLTLDVVLLGLQAIHCALEVPFISLNVLYNVSKANLELVFRVIKKRSESETIKVASSQPLVLCNIIEQITNSMKSQEDSESSNSEDETNKKRSTFLELLILEKIYEICNLIHVTGKYQDYFVLVCLKGIPDDLTGSSDKKTDKKLSQHESDPSANSKSQSKRSSDVDKIFSKITNSLEKKLKWLELHCHGNKHLIANILFLIDCYEKLSTEIAKDTLDLGLPKYIPGYLFSRKATQETIIKLFIPFEPSVTDNLLTRISDYIDWDHWINTVHLDDKVIDLNKNDDWCTKPLMYDGRVKARSVGLEVKRLIEYKQLKSYSKKGIRGTEDFRSNPEKSEKMDTEDMNETRMPKRPTVTASEWKTFDNELSTHGLNLVSIVDNPSILLENDNKKTFISVAVRQKPIFNHLILSGFDF